MASQITNYQCPACTGPLQFNPQTGKLGCEFCGSVFELAEIEALYEKQINIRMISTSEIKVSVIIDKDDADRAVSAIHEKFFPNEK